MINVTVAQSPENQALVQVAAMKDASCIFPLSHLDLFLCGQLHHQHGARGTKFLSLANPCHGGGLCLLKPTFTLCSLSQLCKQKEKAVN